MNNKIKGIYHIVETSPSKFEKLLRDIVYKLQQDGKQVEIKYDANYGHGVNRDMIYSALIIGKISE